MPRDYYEVLGVQRGADETEIKKTFRRMARELHPDVNRHDPGAEEKFKEAAEAYEILSDAERRATYDRFGFEGLDSRGYASQAHGFGSFADIFDAFFGGDPFGAAFGRGGVRKTLQVEIPAGIADDQRIRLSGRGHAGERGGPPGDLYVVVRVAEDERFLRDEEDLVTVVDVPAPLAALGTTIEVPTLDGPVPVEVKAGTQPGEWIALGGRGMPPLRRGGA